MKITTKDLMYKTIAKLFATHLDGENKDGIFITIDGQQYNIKITAKKVAVDFASPKDTTTAPLHDSSKPVDWDELLKQALNFFPEERVKYVQNS